MPGAIAVAAFAVVVASAHFLFGGYFPGPQGMGHDYSQFFPDLLANYYWARTEGPWSPPWFTPAFCGGQPAFPDPQSIYYSLPQVLVAFFEPVTSVYLTLLAFAGLGFAGTWLFLRRSLSASVAASVVGATLFALNGFFSHRMLVGHLAFHGIMLVPWLALAFTAPAGARRITVPDLLRHGAAGALIIAYWIVGGMAVLFIPALLAVFALVLLYALAGGSLRVAVARASVAAVLGLALAASKVAGALAYTRHFPRTGYPLPGMSDVFATLELAVTALFHAPENIAQRAAVRLTNNAIYLGRHEFEFGVTPVPLLLLALGLAFWLYRCLSSETPVLPRAWRTIALGAALLLVLSIPIAINTYAPHWNAFLKSLPVVGSASNLFRWFFIYIPVVAVVSALALDSLAPSSRVRAAVALAAFIAVIVAHAVADRTFYAQQAYDPGPVSKAFAAARTPGFQPSIRTIGAYTDAQGRILINGNNDLLTNGMSQLACYNPMFGYGLEFFPLGMLRVGNALEVRGGYLNVKNPACYVFPRENQCAPGAHFPATRRDDAERFLAYRSFPFERSRIQQVADAVNLVALVGVPALLLVGLVWQRRRRRAGGRARAASACSKD